jgi:hypothetical protein
MKDQNLEKRVLSFVARRTRVSQDDILLAFSDCNEETVTRMIDFLIDDGYLVVVDSGASNENEIRASSHGSRRIKRIIQSQRIGF